MIEIYINDSKLDLRPADTVALTKQINDIAEIQKRQADYTNQFNIPKTPNNVQIFEYLNIAGNQSTRPYKYSNVRLLSNGIPIALKGIAIISETKNQAEYSLHIYAGNYDLYSKINDKYITDIDWSDLLHIFDDTNWGASLANTSGYIYPIADTLNGAMEDKAAQVAYPNGVSLEYQVPHVFTKTIWDRIFSEAGIEYYGNFFTTNKFLNHLTVADANVFDKDLNKFEASHTYSSFTAIYYTDLIIDTFTVTKSGYWKFNARAHYSAQRTGNVYYHILQDGVMIYEAKVRDPSCDTTLVYLDANLDVELFLRENSTCQIAMLAQNHTCSSPFIPEATLLTHTARVELTSCIPFSGTIDFSKFLPKIKQTDYLRAIMQRFGLLYRLDSVGKYHFTTIEDLLNGLEGSSDMSDKFIKETSETYRIGNYGLSNVFKYKYYDKDNLGKDYANATITTDIDGTEKEVTIMDSIIEACGEYLNFREFGAIASLHSFENTETDKTKPEIYKLRDTDVLKTVMLKRKITTSGLNVVYINNIGTYNNVVVSTGTNMPYATFEELKWQNLVEDFYKKFEKMIQKPLKKKVFLWYTPVDIYFLNMFNIIYLKQYQSFFYLNKINNFIAGKPSDCELIKIN